MEKKEMIVEVSPLKYTIKIENIRYSSSDGEQVGSDFQYLEVTKKQMEVLLESLQKALKMFENLN